MVPSALVIRPVGKCQQTVSFFLKQGMDAIGLPLVDVEPQAAVCQAFVTRLGHSSELEIAIFTSTYAADFMIESMQHTAWPERLHIVGIGSSTAARFQSIKQRVCTPDKATSEGLLEMPLLSDVKDKTIAIVKGVGGRVLLEQQLEERGAHVTTFDCYERLPNLAVMAQLRHNTLDINCVIATSGELIDLALQHLDNSWRSKTWVVVSERIAQLAHDKGIEQVVVSPSARDQDLYMTCKTL